MIKIPSKLFHPPAVAVNFADQAETSLRYILERHGRAHVSDRCMDRCVAAIQRGFAHETFSFLVPIFLKLCRRENVLLRPFLDMFVAYALELSPFISFVFGTVG